MAGAVLLAVSQSLSKKELRRVHALDFATELSVFGFLFALVLIPWVDFELSATAYLLILLNGVIWTLAFLFHNKALRHAELSEVAPLTNLRVIATLVFAYFILRDTPDLINLVGILFVVVGAYLLELQPRASLLDPFTAFSHSRSMLNLLFSVVLYGFSAVLIKIILGFVDPASYLFFLYVTLFVSYLVLDFFLQPENLRSLRTIFKTNNLILGLAALTLFAGRSFILLAFEEGSVTLATAVLQSSVFFSVLAGSFYFQEKRMSRRMIFSLLIMVGVILVIL